jgi:flagellar biosynthetic protein FliO
MNQIGPEWSKQVAAWLKRQPKWVVAVGVVFFLLLGTVLLMDTQTPASGQAAAAPGTDPFLNSTGLALGVFARLILVVIAIYICAVLLKRWQAGNSRRPDRQLALMETLHLSQRRSVHLVRAGEQVFLIGSTDQAVTLLGQVNEPSAPGLEKVSADGSISFDQHLSMASQKNIDPMDLK